MKINETSTPVWQEWAVRDPSVSKVVVPDELCEVLRGDSISPSEVSSYIDGVLEDGVFYAVSRHSICWGKTAPPMLPEVRNVGLDPERGHSWVFDEEVTRRFAQRVSGVSTIVSHNHPRTHVSNLLSMCGSDAEQMLDALRRDIDDGIYDYLEEQGVSLTLDEVVNETLSRILSERDIINTPGTVHLLVTDTPRRPASHLNAFRLADGNAENIPVGLLSAESALRQNWHKNVMAEFWKAFNEAGERHERIFESLTLEEQLNPRKAPKQKFYI